MFLIWFRLTGSRRRRERCESLLSWILGISSLFVTIVQTGTGAFLLSSGDALNAMRLERALSVFLCEVVSICLLEITFLIMLLCITV